MLLAGRDEQSVLVVGELEKCEQLEGQVCCARAVFRVMAVVFAHRVVKQCEEADDVRDPRRPSHPRVRVRCAQRAPSAPARGSMSPGSSPPRRRPRAVRRSRARRTPAGNCREPYPSRSEGHLIRTEARLGWAHLGLNQGPLACEASALPLSYAPGSGDRIPRVLPSVCPVALGGELAVP